MACAKWLTICCVPDSDTGDATEDDDNDEDILHHGEAEEQHNEHQDLAEDDTREDQEEVFDNDQELPEDDNIEAQGETALCSCRLKSHESRKVQHGQGDWQCAVLPDSDDDAMEADVQGDEDIANDHGEAEVQGNDNQDLVEDNFHGEHQQVEKNDHLEIHNNEEQEGKRHLQMICHAYS